MKDLSTFRSSIDTQRSKVCTQRKNNQKVTRNTLTNRSEFTSKKISRNMRKRNYAKVDSKEFMRISNETIFNNKQSTRDATSDLKRTDIVDTSFPNSPKIDAPIYNQNLSQNYGSIYEFIDEKSIMNIGTSTMKNANEILPSNFLRVDLIERLKHRKFGGHK